MVNWGGLKCGGCGVELNPNEVFSNICSQCRQNQDAVLDLQDAPNTGTTWEIPNQSDTDRLDWLSTHSVIRVTKQNNIKVKISAKPNGIISKDMFRDYVDMLMEAGESND